MVNQLMTRKQVADFFAVKPVTVRNWQREGLIKPYCRLNGRPRYRMEDLSYLLTSKTDTHAK